MNSVRAGQDIAYYVIVSLILLVVLFLNRNDTVPGTDVSVAAFMLPGLLALQVVFAGAFGVATVLATEREDGTLLRLKAVPYGTVGYVAGQLVRVCIEIAFSMVIVLVPAAFFVPNLMSDGFAAPRWAPSGIWCWACWPCCHSASSSGRSSRTRGRSAAGACW